MEEKKKTDFPELDSSILFEDDAVLVLNKPPGWVVNTAQTYSGATIQDWMEQRLQKTGQKLIKREVSAPNKVADANSYGTSEEIFAERRGIVHRLDKDTSGALLLAKNPEALMELLRQFKAREVGKTYLALVHGKLNPSNGIIRLPLDRSTSDRKKFTVSFQGRLAETKYKLIEFFPGLPKSIATKKGKSYQGFSLVELKPKTGRTHQIRVHMAAIKHPLVSDETYVGRKRIAIDLEWCPRQFLHAKEIVFVHPATHQSCSVEVPLYQDLDRALLSLTAP